MSTNTNASDLLTIVQYCNNIRHIHNTLLPSSNRDDLGRAVIALKSSTHKLESFQNTWLDGALDPIARSETLWGKDGWFKVRELLEEIVGTIQLWKDADNGPDNTKLGRTLFRKLVSFSLSLRPRALSIEAGSVLERALHLDKTIDQLCIQADVSFESLHGIPARKHGLVAAKPQLSRSIPIRHGAIALYQACQRSATQCKLDLDLLRNHCTSPNPQHSPRPASDSSLFYNMRFESVKPDVRLWKITAEAFSLPEGATASTNVKTYEEPDLAVFTSHPPSSSRIIGIQTNYSRDNFYFRVAAADNTKAPASKRESLALTMSKNKVSTEVVTLPYRSLKNKLDSAYNLVQCGFYLLGTPWLASLSNKRLCRLETEDRSSCLLEVKMIPVESFYLENPDALSESSQLFEIGMILIEIALEGDQGSDLEEHENPYLHAYKMLPKVYERVGSTYYRACAFCIQDRRSDPSYGRPEKYRYPEETGWDIYLKDFLEDYYMQVVSRYASSKI